MSKFTNDLKVQFFIGNNPIVQDPKNEFTKLDKFSSISLDLESSKDRMLLEIFLSSDCLEMQGKEYKIIEKTFFLDGTALYINVEDKYKR